MGLHSNRTTHIYLDRTLFEKLYEKLFEKLFFMTTNKLHPLVIIFVCLNLLTVMMPVSTRKERTYTDKGRDLLERNLRGKCKSILRAAYTVAHKIDPLLSTSVPGSARDLELVGEYFHELNQKLFYVKEARQAYFDKFAGDLDLLADFNNWFDPRFSVLQDLEKYTRDWIDKNTVEIHIHHSQMSQSLDYEQSLHPEDSASQIASYNQDNVSDASFRRTSRASTSSSHTSIKSARV